jgi:hypothetical protein
VGDGRPHFSGNTQGEYNQDTREVHAYGNIVNDGNKDGKNVILEMAFEREHLNIGEARIELGDVEVGEQRNYNERILVNLPRYPDNIAFNVKSD